MTEHDKSGWVTVDHRFIPPSPVGDRISYPETLIPIRFGGALNYLQLRILTYFSSTTTSTMPQTRWKGLTGPKELDTIRRSRFFDALDHKNDCQNVTDIAIAEDISATTAYELIKQRKLHGDKAYRRSRKLALRLGRNPIIDFNTTRMIVSKENPKYGFGYEKNRSISTTLNATSGPYNVL